MSSFLPAAMLLCALAWAAPCLAEPQITSATIETQVSLSQSVLAAAREMTTFNTKYKMSYPAIPFPGGDIRPQEGLCCDVVIRAFRSAGIDLQELVYADYKKNLYEYQRIRLASNPMAPGKSNIHRRTAYLDLYFRRNLISLPVQYAKNNVADWQPADIVIFKRNGWETWHIAIVSDQKDPITGEPLLIDAWMEPGFVSETHRLNQYGPIGGHFRLPDTFLEGVSQAHQARARESWNEYSAYFKKDDIARNSPKAPVNGS